MTEFIAKNGRCITFCVINYNNGGALLSSVVVCLFEAGNCVSNASPVCGGYHDGVTVTKFTYPITFQLTFVIVTSFKSSSRATRPKPGSMTFVLDFFQYL